MNFLRRIFGADNDGQETQAARPAVQVAGGISDGPAKASTNEIYNPELIDPAPATAPLAPPLQTRPLTPPAEFKTSTRQVRYGSASHIGQVRGNNQDALLTLFANVEANESAPALGIFIVADGMGGHTDGEQASALTVHTLAHYIVTEVLQHQLVWPSENSTDQRPISEILTDAMNAANEAVQVKVPSGGTTATCAVLRGDLLHVAHVGDSRAYMITDQTVELLTRDHSLVQRLIELGQLSEDEARVHPQRNVLYRAIGQGAAIEPDTSMRRLGPVARLVICTDGLWGVIGEERLIELVRSEPDPQEACDLLIAEANSRGGPDNITVVILQMPA